MCVNVTFCLSVSSNVTVCVLCNWQFLSFLLTPSQSATIDDTSAKKLKVVVIEKDVVVNIPFMLIGLSIILGVIFMFLICHKKVPEVSV